MPAAIPALEVIDRFTAVARELAKLPALVLPQYQTAAQDLYELCQKLLTANENLSRWLNHFLYFDFRQADARTQFLHLTERYATMKTGEEFRQLKMSCADIRHIYHRNVQSKLGNWFTDTAKREEAEGIFTALTDADKDMVAFVYDEVIAQIDDFVNRAEGHVQVDAMDDAEQARLEFKVRSKEVTERLEKFSFDLSDLVIQFADIARVPVTLR
jgi:hypothetical protein